MPAPLRDVPAPAIDLIKAFEGIPDGDPSTVNIDAYLCPAGVWTIGWGHAIVDGGVQLKGAAHKARARALYPGGITREQAQLLLRADLLPRCASVLSLAKLPLDDVMLGALVAFVFNVGAANFGASTLLKRLNAGDKQGAADQFLAWDKARVNGVLQPLAGLTRRRKAERAMFLGEDWRAAAAEPASRSRGALPAPLPVPEAPPQDKVATRKSGAMQPAAKKGAAKQVTAKRPAGKKTVNKQAPPVLAALKPRARTTTPKAQQPAPPAKRPGRQKAR